MCLPQHDVRAQLEACFDYYIETRSSTQKHGVCLNIIELAQHQMQHPYPSQLDKEKNCLCAHPMRSYRSEPCCEHLPYVKANKAYFTGLN